MNNSLYIIMVPLPIHYEISTFGMWTGNSEQFWKYGGISNICFWENLQRWPTHIYKFSTVSHTSLHITMHSLIARFMGPTWGPSGADRTQVGPICWPQEPCYLGITDFNTITRMSHFIFLQSKLLSHCPNLWSTCPAWIGHDSITTAPADVPAPHLTHWGRDNMAAIFKTTFSSALSWTKMQKFRLRFHLNLFLRVQ